MPSQHTQRVSKTLETLTQRGIQKPGDPIIWRRTDGGGGGKGGRPNPTTPVPAILDAIGAGRVKIRVEGLGAPRNPRGYTWVDADKVEIRAGYNDRAKERVIPVSTPLHGFRVVREPVE
jgi:hypothetical protein